MTPPTAVVIINLEHQAKGSHGVNASTEIRHLPETEKRYLIPKTPAPKDQDHKSSFSDHKRSSFRSHRHGTPKST